MCKMWIPIVVLLLWPCLTESKTSAQYGGSRAGVEANPSDVPNLPTLDPAVVESSIAIDGRAEIRVRPTEMRIVLAVTSEGQTARDCHAMIENTIRNLKTSWVAMGIPAANMVEDFIAVLPQYEWSLEKRGSSDDIGVEKKVGYRMQTNIHLAVPNDANAAKAFTIAFEHGVTDIIAFDYWSRELDETKVKAREQALNAARSKSKLLLEPLFDAIPPVINVQEQTTVRYPESLYHSFVNVADEEVTSGWRRDTAFIRALRPRNTYYRGFYSDGDIQAKELPMHPEISVVSSVRLYFESPAAKERKKEKNDSTQ